MLNKIKQYLNNLYNPLLYYIDKNGNSIFKNLCLFKNNGNLYNKTISVKEAGHILEYRIKLGKKLKIYTFYLTIIIYFLFIHTFYNISGLLLCETLWIILYFSGRMICSYLFSNKIRTAYGQYTITDFNPNISENKKIEYRNNYLAKCSLLLIAILIFSTFGLILSGAIKYTANKKNPNYKIATKLSAIYTKIYPIKPFILEISAVNNYQNGDFINASANYIKAIKMSGRNFTEKDYEKFANLLYLVKKSEGSQNAIDTFNEYTTQKRTTIEQQAKLLWIKSMFSIANGLPEFVMNDYDDLIFSLNDKKFKKEKFYILSDKAYMLYLIGDYQSAINIYNNLINYAKENPKDYEQELKRLYAERGFTRQKLGDRIGGDSDFIDSEIDLYEIEKYEPKLIEPTFIIEKF